MSDDKQQKLNLLVDSFSNLFIPEVIPYYKNGMEVWSSFGGDTYSLALNAILQTMHIVLSDDPTSSSGPSDPNDYVNFYDAKEFTDIIYSGQNIPTDIQAALKAGTISVTDIVKSSLDTGNLNTIPPLSQVLSDNDINVPLILPDAGLSVAGLEDFQLDYITSMYLASFSRAPDAEGLMYWGERAVAFMEEDGFDFRQTAAAVNEALYAAGEGNNESGTDLDTASFVETAYQNLLGRSSDEEGLRYWVNNIEAGNVQRSDFLTHFINAAFNAPGDSDQIERLATVAEFMALDNVSGPSVNVDNTLLDSVTDLQNDVEAAQMIANIVQDYGQPHNQFIDIVGLQNAIDLATFN